MLFEGEAIVINNGCQRLFVFPCADGDEQSESRVDQVRLICVAYPVDDVLYRQIWDHPDVVRGTTVRLSGVIRCWLRNFVDPKRFEADVARYVHEFYARRKAEREAEVIEELIADLPA